MRTPTQTAQAREVQGKGEHHPPPNDDGLGLHTLAVSFVGTCESFTAPHDGVVRSGGQRYSARLAYSCLVEPAPEDQVACWRSPQDDGVYIVAILARGSPGAVQTLRLAARSEWHGQTLTLHTQALQVNAASASLKAEQASLVARSLHTVGELCKATWGQLKMAGTSLSTTFYQQVHHARLHQRTVDGLDRTHAQVLEQGADELVHVRAPTVLTEGDRVVKTRGAQIHFG